MADQIVSDLFMRFVGWNNRPILGETRTEIAVGKASLTTDLNKGELIEIESFTFKTGLGGEDEEEINAKAKQQTDNQAHVVNELAKQAKIKGVKVPSGQGFKKFRQGIATTYPVDMKPIEVTRSIDLSSPVLLQHMIERRVFKRVTLIKRKAAGSAAAGEIFFRFDFTDVLIKSIDWDNDEPIKETIEFVCRAVTINYLPQLPDGTLGAKKWTSWSAPRPPLPAVIVR